MQDSADVDQGCPNYGPRPNLARAVLFLARG